MQMVVVLLCCYLSICKTSGRCSHFDWEGQADLSASELMNVSLS